MSSTIDTLVAREYQYGFVTDIEADQIPPGLSEDTVRLISAKKEEPAWLLEWRLKAFRRWQAMTEPHWSNVKYDPIDYQSQVYYSAPKTAKPLGSLDEVDPKLLETYTKLGIAPDQVAEVCNFGYVTVEVLAGDTPAKYQQVYAVNTAGANLGKATETATDNAIVPGCVFWEEKAPNVWLVLIPAYLTGV